MRLFEIMDTAFDNYDNTVRNYLTKTFTSLGMQYTHSQVFGVIFDGMKGIMENIMFYIEDALQEQNIFKATRKQSVYSLAKLSGYEPYYGSTATGTLIGQLYVSNGLDSGATKVYIKNQSTVFNAANSLTYTIILPTDYYVFDVSKPLMTHEFKVVQGTYEQSTHITEGNNFETIHVTATSMFDREYLTVTVDGEEWEEAANMYDMLPDGKQFLLTVGFDNTFDIMFGNNVYGQAVDEGQTVIIKYLNHVGALGNVLPDEYSEFSFVDNGYDSLGTSIDVNEYMSIVLAGCMTGGTDADSIQFIRQMIGYNSRSLVLASEKNFKLFFKRFSFIGYVNCWSEKNSMCVTASCMRDISEEITSVDSYYNFDTSKLLLTDSQKEMIITTLDNSNKAFAGVTLKFQDPVVRRFAIICYVKVDNVYNRETAKEGIKTSLANYFLGTFEGVQFIAKSDLIKKIVDENSVITAIDIDIISELGEQAYYNGYYNKYELKMVNGTYQYITKQIMYEEDNTPGLDGYGNISLDSKLEVPILQGSFNYYPNKDTYDKNDCINIETVQIYFI